MKLIGVTAALVLTAAVACSDQSLNGLADTTPPTIKLATSTSTVDSVLSFAANVTDNLGIARVHIDATGGVTASFDSVFHAASTSAALSFSLSVPRSVPAGTPVTLIGYAYDGAGNRSAPDTLKMGTGNLAPATVVVTAPVTGSAVVIGKSTVVAITGTSKVRVQFLGYQTSGAFTASDSTAFNSPLADSSSTQLTMSVPASIPAGSVTITPFIRDSLGNRGLGSPITLKVQAATGVKAAPIVNFGSDKRVEVNDTVSISAIDTTGSGITDIGYEITSTIGGPIVVQGDSTSNGQSTSLPRRFNLKIPSTLVPPFPATLYIKAFAATANGARGYAKLASGIDRVDTLTVVAGVTRQVPNGGTIADAIYHPRYDRLYLTNIDRNELEVFSLGDSTFHAPIAVGSRPWGIAAWPRNPSTGDFGDTLLVANSGGTSIGYVNLLDHSIPFSGEGREVYRYPLPHIRVYTVKTVAATGTNPPVNIQQLTAYDFSDRPQYIASTCRPATQFPSGSSCDQVVLVYSTTPTPGQSTPFPNQGTVRYENLTTQSSHFFFEQAMGQTAGTADSLRIDRFGVNCDRNGQNCAAGSDSTLVPFQQPVGTKPHVPTSASDTVIKLDTIYSSTVVQLPLIAFRDSTFVRSSGNFARAVLGEGGTVQGSRVMGFTAAFGLDSTVTLPNGVITRLRTPVVDLGVSSPARVADLTANTFARVGGVAINFDGALAAVRADSIYLFNQDLRHQGTFQTATSGNPGFDFHPLNAGNGITGASPLKSCYSFAASTEPSIEVYENNHFRRIAVIPIKNPIIGPIKSAVRQPSGQLILVGATSKGVVIVNVDPTIFGGVSCPP
ncbi:MAG: hypothetical protein M3R65_05685 [Gemmatimonadota bacterium]|nr:hypothetical protein [Gemmatimonadota bacterium]